MAVLTHVLQPDTQVILLLCAGFGQSRQADPMPLSLGEYNVLAQKLQQQHLRPADLLSTNGKNWVLDEVNGSLGYFNPLHNSYLVTPFHYSNFDGILPEGGLSVWDRLFFQHDRV